MYKYTLEVTQVYKGKITKKQVAIYTGGRDCGYVFQVGQSYIVYATKKIGEFFFNTTRAPIGKNIFWTNSCTRTQKVNVTETRQLQKTFKRSNKKCP